MLAEHDRGSHELSDRWIAIRQLVREIFRQLREGGVDAVHVTITYHETLRETVLNIEQWNRWFERFPDLIFQGSTANDIALARETGRTAIFFGSQNPSCMEDDIGLIEILHTLGLRFMQLTYNNQSLLAAGCYESDDTGLTRMGRAMVAAMNRVGLVVDMSHSGERATPKAIEHSTRPIAITHANPAHWHPALRNKSDTVLKALAASGGMLGLSLYPHHLNGSSACALNDFCTITARLARMGSAHPTRLSFLRVLQRRIDRENWQFARTVWDVDANGVGRAVYRVTTPARVYALMAFAHGQMGADQPVPRLSGPSGPVVST